MKGLLFYITIMAGILSCTKENPNDLPEVIIESDFEQSPDGWITDFADYPVGDEMNFEFKSSHTALPPPLDESKKAIFISGTNRSDDLFMYLKKEITGLKQNTVYTAKFTIDVASNAPSNAIGVGGAPGESVYFGIGIANIEPNKIIDGTMYSMNIDKGNQSTGGTNRKVIGNIANGTSESKYVMLRKQGELNFTTQSDSTVWAMVSTDSGFESTTALYYDYIKIIFTPQ